jgi:glycosyltransferase involved in cell wall biosynthesis
MDPVLSICIATYNRSNFLKEAIESVINQINESVELLISDNCSEDNTKDVVLGILRDNPDKNINYLRNEINLGIDGNVLNLLYKAKGQFILFLADDDILAHNSVDYILRLLNNYTIAMIYLNYYTIDHYGLDIIHFPKMSEDLVFQDKNKFLDFLSYNISFISSTLINRKLAFSAVNKYNLIRFKNSHQLHYYISLAVCSIKPEDCYLIFTAKQCIIQRIDPNPPWNGFYIFGTKVIRTFKDIREFGYDKKITNKVISNILINFVSKGALVTLGKNRFSDKDIKDMYKEVYNENKYNILFWLLVFPIFLVPRILLVKMYQIYKKLK